MSVAKSYIALGSNLENPILQLNTAIQEIEAQDEIHNVIASSYYRTKPIGPEQPDIINAVIGIETSLSPLDLLYFLQSIEQKHKRVRTVRFGARTLDLDILLYGDLTLSKDETLIIPHPRMHLRNFVLFPLLEVAGDISLPEFGVISSLIEKNDPEDYVVKIEY